MQKAAKEKVLKLIFAIASVLFLCAPSTASSTSTSGLENRVELFLLGGENRTEPPAFGTANRVENYDSFWGTALESPVAPNPGAHISPITGRAVDLSGRIRQVKPANGPTRFTPVRQNGNPVAAGMDHVRARHYGGTNSQSQFSIASDELSSILQSRVVREAPLQQIGSGRQAMWSRDVNVGRIVGRTRVADGANPTSTLRVFVDEAGNLITTFPVPGT